MIGDKKNAKNPTIQGDIKTYPTISRLFYIVKRFFFMMIVRNSRKSDCLAPPLPFFIDSGYAASKKQ